MDLQLNGRVAVVTGASSGLGLAIARELSTEGTSVAMVARREDLLRKEAAELSAATSHRVLPVPGDVSKQGDAERVVGGPWKYSARSTSSSPSPAAHHRRCSRTRPTTNISRR